MLFMNSFTSIPRSLQMDRTICSADIPLPDNIPITFCICLESFIMAFALFARSPIWLF